MNGVHDLGGMAGFGPVVPEPVTPVFHADWEKRVLGFVYNLISRRNLWDEFRFSIESVPPVRYLASSYYERWLIALEGYLLERGELDPNEYDVSADAPRPIRPTSLAELSYAATGQGAPRRQPGDRVRARNINPAGHTRLPRYARGKRGVVHRYHGDFPFADTNAARLGDQPQPLYSVAFTARELWGDGASEQDTVYLDLWESYLEPE